MGESLSGVQSTRRSRPESLEGRRVLVVGLGRFGGGVGVTRWVASQGAIVTVTDQAPAEALSESIEAIADLEPTLRLGGHSPEDLDGADLVIINPAVNKTRSDFFKALLSRGVPWTTEMNLFCERCPARIVGVTGSYGKSTTCTMLAEALRAGSDTEVHLGGNIGRSLLMDLPKIRPGDTVVLEMSNAQLEDLPRIRWAPPVAVITNVYPHHLDRYPTFAEYADAKLNIVRDPRQESKVIVGEVHPEAERMLDAALADRRGDVVRVRRPDSPIRLRVPGGHNQANAACALTVCECLGFDETVARDALQSFAGLEHRLQCVRTVGGIEYFNDSKATSPDATIAALNAFESSETSGERNARGPRIVAIVGGQKKDAPLGECAAALAGACRAVVCTGESGPGFAEAVRSSCGVRAASGGASREVIIREAADLATAVGLAREYARLGDVVLYSPGAPSFDGYVNFAARGRHFVELVDALET
jgi:UDP-N-acetylmuramoylalanine--D-glutamate ligase